jgi:hypothetical protein
MFNLRNFVGERFGCLKRRSFRPFWLINSDLVQHRGELVSILGGIDLLRICT